MSFPRGTTIWCFTLISQRNSIEQSLSLCTTLTPPPGTFRSFEPTSAEFARKTKELENFVFQVPENKQAAGEKLY